MAKVIFMKIGVKIIYKSRSDFREDWGKHYLQKAVGQK
jgi:hypothetical protein